MPLHLFCENTDCGAYLGPTARECHHCGTERASEYILPAPNQPYWSAKLPGELACPPLLWREYLLVAWKRKEGEGGLAWLNPHDGKSQGELLNVGKPVLHPMTLIGDVALLTLGGEGKAGKGSLAAVNLNTREILWKRDDLPGMLERGANVESQRAFVACGDGVLYCLDVNNKGDTIWHQRYMDKKVAAPRLLVPYRKGVLLGTPEFDGRIMAVSRDGVAEFCQFSQRISGGWLNRNRLYVILAQGLAVVDLDRNGAKKMLHEAEMVSAFEGKDLLIVGTRLGNDKRFVRALTKNGDERWSFNTGGSVSALLERDGLLYAGDSHGKLYVLDAASGAEVCHLNISRDEKDGIAPHLQMTDDEKLIVGTRNGSLCSLPWHLGQYEVMARRLKSPGAAAFYCVAADYAPQNEKKDELRELASESWAAKGFYNEAARMWEEAGELQRAAKLYEEAGHSVSGIRPKDGVRFRLRAMKMWDELFWSGNPEAEGKRDHQLDSLKLIRGVRIPLLRARLINAPKFIERGTGEFTIKLKNVGLISATQISLIIGGGLVATPKITNFKNIFPNAEVDYTFTITPTRSGELRLEFTYRDYSQEYPPLTALLTFPIEVKESLVLQTGDVGMLKLTSETVVVYGRDVGAMIAHGDIANASAAGDVGVMSGKKNTRKCAECGVDNKLDDKFCANCGVELK